jgi:DNA-binding transcriptional LysR family regulator
VKANLQTTEEAWDDVRVFLAVHRHRTLAAAGARLGLDTSTVSRRLAALERQLGTRLFDRTRRGLASTRASERIAAAAEAMEAAYRRLSRDAADRETVAEGVVRVACVPGISSIFIAPALVRLRRSHPKLMLELDVAVQSRDLTRGDADLALRTVRSTGADLVTTKLVSARWVAATSRALAHALGRVARWGDAPWLTWDHDFASLQPARWISAHVPASAVVLRTSDFVAQLAAAKAGLGVVLAPEQYLARQGLEPVRFASALQASTGAWPVDDLFLVGHRQLRDVPRVAAVWSFLMHELRGEA